MSPAHLLCTEMSEWTHALTERGLHQRNMTGHGNRRERAAFSIQVFRGGAVGRRCRPVNGVMARRSPSATNGSPRIRVRGPFSRWMNDHFAGKVNPRPRVSTRHHQAQQPALLQDQGAKASFRLKWLASTHPPLSITADSRSDYI